MGSELLFKTDNFIDRQVRWKCEQSDSGIRFVPNGGITGVCMALTVKWLQKSIRSGGIRSASELYPNPIGLQLDDEVPEDFQFNRKVHACTLAGSVQSALYAMKSVWGTNIDAYSHLKDPEYSLPECSLLVALDLHDLYQLPLDEGKDSLDLDEVIDDICCCNGHFSLLLQYANGPAHIMGFRHNDQILQWFEPNCGLYEFSDKESLGRGALALFTRYDFFGQEGGFSKWLLSEVNSRVTI